MINQPVEQASKSLGDVIVMFLAIVITAGLILPVIWLLKRPRQAMRVLVPVAIVVGLFAWLSETGAQLAFIGAAVFLLAWRVAHPRSFRPLVGVSCRSAWRRLWVYERQWHSAMMSSGLWKGEGKGRKVPVLSKVAAGKYADVVELRMLNGQSAEDFHRVVAGLATSFGADLGCRVKQERSGRLLLEFVHHDALVEVVEPLPIPKVVDLYAVPIGRHEDGAVWTLPVAETHTLVAGVTGAGKGSVLWSLIHGLLPAVHDGTVQLWVGDPKGGMEFGPGRKLYARFEDESAERIVKLVEDARDLMMVRAKDLKARDIRQHIPTPDEPLILVFLDEIAALTAFMQKRDLKDRFNQALGVLLMQGRAVGVDVVAALQDPRKEVLNLRNLFPQKVGLQLEEAVQVDMVLGAGARDRGARCDEIKDSQRGVGYVKLDGVREMARVRASWVPTARIIAMSYQYAAPVTEQNGLKFVKGRVELDAEQEAELQRAWQGPVVRSEKPVRLEKS